LTVAPSSVVFSLWHDYDRRGQWPRAGGRLDQPLTLLIHIQALDMVIHTKRLMQTENFDWSALSKLQTDLIRWIEADNG